MTLEYITTRDLENNGKIRIVKVKEASQANVELTCPECGNIEKRKENWGEPFVTGTGVNQRFNLSCNKCGYKMKLLKLKKEVKKK
jgi:RNase P subunit RPR2